MNTLNKKVPGIVSTLLLIVLPIFTWSQRWYIYDTYRLYNYTPSERIVSLADTSSMNDKAKKLFYVYHPKLNNKTEFNDNCKSSEQTIVLGCYIPRNGIYIFNVTDERLDGILEVTAAHEMLHAAYERLSSKDKKYIGKLVNNEFNKTDNERIKETISNYQKNGADINNELHSILATEVRELSPELEAYYKKYFINRTKIVDLSEKYEKSFSDRKLKVDAIDKQLENLKKQIYNSQTELEALSKQIEIDKQNLNMLLKSKEIEQYNAGVGAYNQKINLYNSKVRSLRNQIESYNNLVSERNAIAMEENELHKAIDSRPDTIEN